MSKDLNTSGAATLSVGTGAAKREIASILWVARDASSPTLVWMGGYKSDMQGSKALAVEALAKGVGLGCLRFDYSGHGVSGGDFANGNISRWLEETLSVIAARVPDGQLILIGSSMGGWIALRSVQELRKSGQGDRIAGLVLIAPAPDFTVELIEPALSEAEKRSLEERGYFEEPSEYGPEPYLYTKTLMDDGRDNRVLVGTIETGCPVHILQGVKDGDVPYTHALRLMEHLPADDVVLTLIADGDHRLSRPRDLERLGAAIMAMVGPQTASA